MELVEGDDLSLLISRGPIPLADALPIAKQIADALEAAHEQGIVHRDLKPANIKIRADGTVKVLAEQGLTLGTPAPLPIDDAIHPLVQRNYDVTPDGKQLLIVLPVQTVQTTTSRRASAQINVVLNWFEELRAHAPVK